MTYPRSSDLQYTLRDNCFKANFKASLAIEAVTNSTNQTLLDQVYVSVKAPVSVFLFHYERYRFGTTGDWKMDPICGYGYVAEQYWANINL